MCKCNIVCQQHNDKGAEWLPAAHQAYQATGIAEKVHTFVTKKKPEGNSYDIQPFWVMPVTPLLKFFEEVHII